MASALDWRRIDSGRYGERRHTVYWTADVGHDRRLSVARIYNDDGTWTPRGPWRWTVRRRLGKGRIEILAEGRASTVPAGKAAAQRAMFQHG